MMVRGRQLKVHRLFRLANNGCCETQAGSVSKVNKSDDALVLFSVLFVSIS